MRQSKLQLKLRGRTTKQELNQAIATAETAGATAVRPLFPASDDPELATLFVIDARDPAAAKRIRLALAKVKCVEFVEEEVRRSLRSS
jgi:hypothetical protein